MNLKPRFISSITVNKKKNEKFLSNVKLRHSTEEVVYNLIKTIKILLVPIVLTTMSLSIPAADHTTPPLLNGGIHSSVSKEITNEVNKTLGNLTNNLEVKPNVIFSPVFSEVTNLVVKPNVKIIYNLELPVNTSIYKENKVIHPIFDLRVEQPVEFKIHDQQILIDDTQIIDYKEVMNQIVNEKKVFPPIQIELQSEVNSEIYNLTVIPEINSAVFKYVYKEKEVLIPIYSDFKIENKKLFLIHNEKIYDLRVLPPEIYSEVYDEIEKNQR